MKKLMFNRFELCIFLVSFFLVVLPGIIWNRVVFTGDNFNYILIGKSIFVELKPFYQKFVSYFYFHHPVEYHHYVFQPLFPILLSPILFIFQNASEKVQFYSAFCSNAIFVGISTVLFSRILKSLKISPILTYVGVLMFLLIPSYLIDSTLVHSEALYVLILLLQISTFYKSVIGRGTFVMPGILLGLLYLTRPNGLFVATGEVLFLFLYGNKKFKSLFTLLGTFGLIISPWLIRNFLIFKNPIFSVYKFQVWLNKNDFQTWSSPPDFQWMMNHYGLKNYISDWFIRYKTLILNFTQFEWALIIFPVALAFLFLKNFKKSPLTSLLFIIIITESLGQSMHFFITERHMLTFTCLIILLYILSLSEIFQLISKFRRASLRYFVVILILILPIFFYSPKNIFRYKKLIDSVNKSKFTDSKYQEIGSWLKTNLPNTSTVLATPPDGYSFFSSLKTIGVPENIATIDIGNFQKLYPFEYYLFDPENSNFIFPNSIPIKEFNLKRKLVLYKLQP